MKRNVNEVRDEMESTARNFSVHALQAFEWLRARRGLVKCYYIFKCKCNKAKTRSLLKLHLMTIFDAETRNKLSTLIR